MNKMVFAVACSLALALGGCCGKRLAPQPPRQSVLSVLWTPDPSHIPTGPVNLEGYFSDPNGNVHPWQTLCAMKTVDGGYACEFGIPAGSQAVFAVRYARADAGGGYCWTFDLSPVRPCGGNGHQVGTLDMTIGGMSIPYDLRSNGVGPQSTPGPYYFNGAATLPR